MYLNTAHIEQFKPSRLVAHVKQQQRARRRARQRETFWLTFKAVMAATATWAIGGAILGFLLYITLISLFITQATGIAQ